MSLDRLHPSIRDPHGQAELFRSAQPFPHIVFDEFLAPDFLERIEREFPTFKSENALNDFGEPGGKAVVSALPEISPAYNELDALLQSSEFLDWTGRTVGIAPLLYDAEYFGGGTHENIEGEALDPHVDFNIHPRRRWHRRLNLILFLNREWELDWGGCLRLHRNPWLPESEDEIKTVLPLRNRAVIFETSERSWHGFERIRLPEAKRDLSRRSVAVYYYTAERPADEAVAEHSTYYVPPRLPERFQPGRTLDEQDVQDIQGLLDGRDRQLRFFWERERELREVFELVEQSPSYKLGRALTWPLRKIRDSLKG